MRKTLAGLIMLVCLCAHAVAHAQTSGATAVTVDYFFEPGCNDCAGMQEAVLPALERQYAGRYVLRPFDVGVLTNYLKLVAAQERAGAPDNAHVTLLLDDRRLLSGLAQIRTNLFPAMEACLRDRAAGRSTEPAGLAPPVAQAFLARRLKSFTLAGVLAAGLIDSINPCAISTLVFFMSLLSVARVGRARMWLAGGAFVAATFVTYVALGFGLFRVLYLVVSVRTLRHAVDAAMIAVLAVFAWLSFRDALRYRRTGNPSAVTLQLPAGLKARARDAMRRGLRTRNLLLGGLSIGVVVTVLESVCTGQVYVPTLVFLIRGGQSLPASLGYLLAYNLMFVLPLVVILALTCGGLQTMSLLAWSRRNVVASKVLLGLFFLAMIGLLVAL